MTTSLQIGGFFSGLTRLKSKILLSPRGGQLSTQFGVDLVFRSKNQGALEKFAKSTSRLDDAAKKAQGSLNRASNSITKTGRAAQNADNKVKRLTRSFGTLKLALATLGVGVFVKGMFDAAASIERTKLQLKTLVGTAEGAERVYRELQKINKQSPFQIKDLSTAATRLSAYGVKTENLTKTTRQLGLIAAGTGQDIQGIATAYGQVVAKGRLQGDELMQFMERGVDVSGELQKMLGLSKEEFESMTSKGLISAELVQIAIANMTGETGRFNKAFENTADSLDTKLSNMQDAFHNAAGALGAAFKPVFEYLLNEATKFLNLFTNVLGNWKKESSLGNNRIQELKLKAGKVADDKFGIHTLGKEKENFRNSTFRNYVDAEVASRNKPSVASQVEAAAAPTPGTYDKAQTAEWRKLLGEQEKNNDESKGRAAAIGKQLMGNVIEALTGDKSSQFYRADHGGQNYHVHVAFENQQQKELAKALLQSKGIQIGSENDGRHAAGSYHYSNQAFDVPMSQVPVGQEDAFSQKIFGILGKEFGGLLGGSGTDVVGELVAKARVELDKLRESAAQTWQSMQQGILGTNTNLEQQVTDLNEVNRLVMEGMDPSVAQTQISNQRALLDIDAERISKLSELKSLQGLSADELKTKEDAINAAFDKRLSLQGQLNEGRGVSTQLAEQQAQAEQLKQQVSGLAGGIASEFTNAFKGVINGTKDVQTAFGDMLAGIAERFLDFAMSILQDAITKQLVSLFGNLLGGGLGGGGGLGSLGGGSLGAGGGSMFGNTFGGFSGMSFAGGGYTGDGARAGGVDGQGGFPAILHPQESVVDHSKAMGRWNGGNSASVGADAAAGEGAEGGKSGVMSTTVNYTGPTLNFSGNDYLPKSAAGELIATAAKQGAKQGEAMAIRRLRQNPSTRRKLGL